MSGISADIAGLFRGRRAASVAARWIAWTLLLVVVSWSAGLAILLAIANRVHVDVPYQQAIKLPLLKFRPGLIFAGYSRMFYNVDPA